MELVHDFRPQHTGSSHFGNFHKVVHADAPEEGEAGGKIIDIHACVDTGAELFQTVSQRVSQLNIASRTGFLHVIAGD